MVKNILLCLIGIFLVTSLVKNVIEYRRNVKFYNTFKNDYESEKKKNNKLKMQAIKESDPMELEKTIRNKLNLIKENEIAIIVPTPTSVPITPTPTPQPVYRQWFDIFLKN